MRKKTITIVVVALVLAVVALAAHLAGGSILATAREHLGRLGF